MDQGAWFTPCRFGHGEGTIDSLLETLTDWAAGLVESLGYLGVAMLVAIENVFPPIPSEVVLGLAGYAAARGDASLVGMIAAACIGSVLGAWITYGVSWAIGPRRLRAVVIRHGSWLGVRGADLDRAEAWFDRWSRTAVLICRCVPLVRSLISIPAGIRRMPFPTFTLYTLFGSALWNTVLIVAAYLLADQWDRLLDVTGPVQNVVLLLGGALLAVFVGRKVVSARRDRTAARSAGRDRAG